MGVRDHRKRGLRKKKHQREANRIVDSIEAINSLGLTEKRFDGTFFIKRAVDDRSTVANQKLNEFREQFHGRLFRYLGVSLLSPTDSYKLIGQVEKRGRSFNLALAQEAVEEFCSIPTAVFLGSSKIHGAKKNEKGPRFPTITLAPESRDQIRHERQSILGKFGVNVGYFNSHTPHISLMKTYDQLEAENVLSDLQQAGLFGEPIHLDPAQLIQEVHKPARLKK